MLCWCSLLIKFQVNSYPFVMYVKDPFSQIQSQLIIRLSLTQKRAPACYLLLHAALKINLICSISMF